MLSTDGHPGLFTIVGGVALLVFAGLGLSLMADRRAARGETNEGREAEIERGRTEIASLKEAVASSGKHLDDFSKRSAAAAEAYAKVRGELAPLDGRIAGLTAARNKAETDLLNLERESAVYQRDRRAELRAAGAGIKLSALRTKDGTIYHQVEIRRVTSTGIEISYNNGAKGLVLPATRLERAYHDRFQWTSEELELAGRLENGYRDAPASAVLPGGGPSPAAAGGDPATAARLAAARDRVRNAQSRLEGIERQLSEAEEAMARGERSVPSSLETWEKRANKLRQARAAAEAEASAAKAALKSMRATPAGSGGNS